MRDLFLRVRAALTPSALLVLALVLLLGVSLMHKGDPRTALEKRTEAALTAISGAGDVQVVIRMREAAGRTGLSSASGMGEVPCGAIVIAQGAEDPWVQLQLQESLCALLGLPASAVSVVAGGD